MPSKIFSYFKFDKAEVREMLSSEIITFGYLFIKSKKVVNIW